MCDCVQVISPTPEEILVGLQRVGHMMIDVSRRVSQWDEDTILSCILKSQAAKPVEHATDDTAADRALQSGAPAAETALPTALSQIQPSTISAAHVASTPVDSSK